jgi:hypothetical protein
VFNGAELWVGNDKCEKRDYQVEQTPLPGVLEKLEEAVDRSGLAKAGPPGSKSVVIAYSIGAQIVSPMGELSKLRGASLGDQCNYFGKSGSDLVRGVELAFHELKIVTAARKVMIVVGDGSASDPEQAKAELARFRTLCEQEKIDVFAIVYVNKRPGDDDKPQQVITSLAPTAKTATTTDDIAGALAAITTATSRPFN